MLRFRFDREKSQAVKRKHGLSLKDAQAIFDQAYLVDQKSDDPEQFRAMPKTSKKAPTADEIAAMATRGEDISRYFTNRFTAVRPLHRVNVDLTQGMLRDLDARAAKLNISRQAVIKTLLGRALSEDSPGTRAKHR